MGTFAMEKNTATEPGSELSLAIHAATTRTHVEETVLKQLTAARHLLELLVQTGYGAMD